MLKVICRTHSLYILCKLYLLHNLVRQISDTSGIAIANTSL
ncbi:hypothetical protein COO91_10202 (plasmid) [Nostoc flagelliforme CCNUN1]|uniref:Uncharacterized protein n=1 Tax=Nostoc flagelliforme CCNUN1 TaxID=2038116 RepID=A0A2K8T8G6_9NOSO|nr:hypothetical protein COO91_10202 [Nostoc flagelliforme CCNUN1]